jgi:CHAT domain-containing protein
MVAPCAAIIALALLPAPLAGSTTKTDADALLAKGRQLYQQEDYLGARAPFEQALSAYQQLDLMQEEADALLELGVLLVDIGEYDGALKHYSRALAICRRLGSREKEARALAKLGDLEALLAHYQSAMELRNEELTVWRQLGREKEQAETLGALEGVHRSLSQFGAAVEDGEAALKIWRRLGLEKEQADILCDLGWIGAQGDNYEAATGYFKQSQALYHKLGNEEGQAGALAGLGDVSAMELGWLASSPWAPSEEADGYRWEAIAHLEKALAAYRAAGRPKEEASALESLAWSAASLGQREAAARYVTQARGVWQKLGMAAAEASAVLHLAGLAAEPEEGARLCQEALSDFRRLGMEKDAASALIVLGDHTMSRAQRNNLDECLKALGYYQQAIEIDGKLGLNREAAFNLLCLGDYTRRLCRWYGLPEYDKAEAHYEQALALCQKLGLSHLGGIVSFQGLGDLARMRGEYGKAEKAYQDAIGLFRGIGEMNWVARGYEVRGDMAKQIGRYEEAADYLTQAKKTWEMQRDRTVRSKAFYERLIALDWAALAGIADDVEDYQTAIKYDEQALASSEKVEDRDDISVKRHMAQVRMNQGQLSEARALLERLGDKAEAGDWGRYHLLSGAFQTAEREFQHAGTVPGDFISTAIGLGLAEEGLKHWDQAAKAYTQAIDAIERLRASTPAAERGRFFEAKDGGFRRLEPYEGLVRVLHQLGRDDEAFYRSEYTRARVLVEGVARNPFGASLGLPEEVRQREDGLVTVLSTLSKQHDEKPDDSQIALQLQLKQDEHDQLVRQLRQQYPEYALIQYPQPLRPSELKLDPKEVLLVYKVTGPQTLLFLVRQSKVEKVFEIALKRSELNDLVSRYRAGLAGVGKLADLRGLDLETGRKLYELLLAPALAEVKADEQVLVVPDEVLELLPLEALVSAVPQPVTWKEGGRGPYPEDVHYVGDSRAFAYWQSGTAMGVIRGLPRPAGGDRVLVIADPILSAEGTPRGALTGEVATQDLGPASGERAIGQVPKGSTILTTLWPLYGDRLRPLVGMDASEARFKRESLGEYRVLVFATHGVLDAPGLGQPALVLTPDREAGEDGYLTMTEVMQLKLHAELVAVMACDTGAGKRVSGEGVMAMGRAFQYAGARSVLASRWKAEDASTNLLTKVFFEQWAAGKDKATALQVARQRLRDAGYLHPFYWAGFILIGEQSTASEPGTSKER